MNISSGSLFHFTPKFEYLQSIIESGFKFRACCEELPLSGYRSCIFDQLGIVRHVHDPFVICFCDLPLSASQDHRLQYGQYAIAMTKEWGMMNEVTPIRYVHAHSPDFTSETYNKVLDLPYYLQEHGHDLFRLLSHISAESGDAEAPTDADFQNLPNGVKKIMASANAEFMSLLSHMNKVMQYVRAYEGDWTDRANGQPSHRTFYDEREWRAASPAEDDRIAFKFRDIRHLIVTSDAEKKTLSEQIIAASDDLEVDDETQVWSKIHIGEELLRDI